MVLRITSGNILLFAGHVDDKIADNIVRYARNREGIIDNFEDTIRIVGKYYNLQKEDILRKCRMNELVAARALVYYRLVVYLGHTQSEVAKYFSKNHSTIINGIKTAREYHKYAYKNIFGEELK
jgi:chromosomal replication initiation ATPase DnaA